MLTVPGIDPKRIKCDDGDIKRVRLDSTVVAYLSPSGDFWFDGKWESLPNGFGLDAKAALKVVITEWLASDGTRLWPPPPPDLLEVAKEVLPTLNTVLASIDRPSSDWERYLKNIHLRPVVSTTIRSVTTCVLSPEQVRAILANYLTRELETPVSPDSVTLKASYSSFDFASVEIVCETKLPKPPTTRG